MRTFRTYHEVASDPDNTVAAQVAEQRVRLRERLAAIRGVWLIASGKGGVGKSVITANLAAALGERGLRIGALDADLNGPSLARMLGAGGALPIDGDAVRPAAGAGGTRVMSSDLLLREDAPVEWRGPGPGDSLWQSLLETGAVREFLADVEWGELDALLLDLAPGTDKLRRVFELVPEPAGVLIVTTPSEATRAVVARSLRLVRELGARRVALVANMTAHECASCGHREPLFAADGARRLAEASGVEVWAEIPFHPALSASTDAGRPLVLADPSNPAARAITLLADRLASQIAADAAAPGTAETGR